MLNSRTVVSAIAACVLLVSLLGLLTGKPRINGKDDVFYLLHAYSIAEFGTFALVNEVPPPAPPKPGGLAGPLYPAYLAVLMKLSPDFRELTLCAMQKRSGCAGGIGVAWPVQLAIGGLTTALVLLGTLMLTGSRMATATATLVFALSGVPVHLASELLTENFFVPLVFAFGLALVASVRHLSWRWGLVAGLMAGLAGLTRPPMTYIGFLTALAFLIAGLWLWHSRKDRRLAVAAVAMLAAFGTVTGAWSARNAAIGGAGMTSEMGARNLTGRIGFNDMSTKEWFMAWVYWLPDFGDGLGGALFGKDAVHKLNLTAPDGYFYGGIAKLGQELEEATGIGGVGSGAEPRIDPLKWMVETKILGDLRHHVPVTFVLAWRGLFVEKYVGLIGALALALVLVSRRFKPLRRDLLVLTLPFVALLGLHAFVSVNVPRYNLHLLLPMMIAVGVLAADAAMRLQSWNDARQRARPERRTGG